MSDWLLELRQVRKDYGALRPLRLRELQVAPGALVALLGLDAPAAQMFVNLVDRRHTARLRRGARFRVRHRGHH